MKKIENIEEETVELEIDGVTKKFDLLFSFDCVQNGRTYIAITDGSFDEEGDAVIAYASYNPNEENPVLYDVTSQLEMEMIDKVFDDIQKEINGKEE